MHKRCIKIPYYNVQYSYNNTELTFFQQLFIILDIYNDVQIIKIPVENTNKKIMGDSLTIRKSFSLSGLGIIVIDFLYNNVYNCVDK